MIIRSHPLPPKSQAQTPHVLVAVTIGLGLQVLVIALGISPVAQGQLIDTDSYMKLVRIEQLLATGGWFDNQILRSNAPYGETLHWTRLFDLIVIAGAGLLHLFMPLRDAVFWSGALVSPFLYLGIIVALIWAAGPLMSEATLRPRVMGAILTSVQSMLFGYTVAGRADHHALLALLLVLLVAALLHTLRPGIDGFGASSRNAATAGAIAGVGVWASVEMLIPAGAAALALGFAWVIRGSSWLRLNLVFALAFVASTIVALVVERPWTEWFVIESDRLSIMQVAIAAALLGVWISIAAVTRHSAAFAGPAKRIIGATFAGSTAAIVLIIVFPTLAAGPLGAMDPRLHPIFLTKVTEMQPAWPTTWQKAAEMLQLLGIGLAAIPFLLWLLVAERRRPEFLSRAGLAIMMFALLPIALEHRRFAPYVEIVLGLALFELLRRMLVRGNAERNAIRRAVVWIIPAMLMFVAPMFIGAMLSPRSGEASELSQAVAACPVRKVAALLTAPGSEWARHPHTILATIYFGPELLYRTPHRVIGTPYHRNAAGIYDAYRALAGSEETARYIVSVRRVDLILLCPRFDPYFFDSPAGQNSFYQRLLQGKASEWLAPVSLPAALASEFKLFRVLER